MTTGWTRVLLGVAVLCGGAGLRAGGRMALLVTALVAGAEAVEPPAGKVFSSKVRLEAPKKGNDKRSGDRDVAPYSIFVPEEVEVVRGVVFNPFYEKAVEQKHWRTAAAHWNFALMGANLFGVRKSSFAEVVSDGLKEMAAASGRPEIANAPLCVVGMSAGGGMAVSIAEALPERVIAAAPVCLEVGPRDAATRGIPMITVFGERDGKQMEKLTAKLPEQRAQGARWAIAVQWGRRHEFAKANNMILPFFDAVIAQRYPSERNPATGIPVLERVPEKGGWFGDQSGWSGERPAAIDYVGPKNWPAFKVEEACWFPDGTVAWIWRAFVARERKVKILDPPGLGDGQPLVLHEAGNAVEVKVAVAGELSLLSLSLYRGSRRLQKLDGDARRLSSGPLPAGIHTLTVVGSSEDGRRHYSQPHTILVR